ncbi:hypothetical protein APX86_25770, partial [Escherichia coli]
VFSDQASIASWALFTLHRKKLYEYRNANEQNISVKMSSPEHYSRSPFDRHVCSYSCGQRIPPLGSGYSRSRSSTIPNHKTIH